MLRLFLTSVSTVAAICSLSGQLKAETIAYWQFEEGTPGTTANGSYSVLDSSGNGLHGTPYGGPIYTSLTDTSRHLGLQFDGVNDRVFIPDDSRFRITGSLTLEAFIRIDSYPSPQAEIVWRGDNRAGIDPYRLRLGNTGHLVFGIYSSSGDVSLVSPEPLPIGKLLHVAGTLDDGTGEMKLFINQSVVNSTTTDLRPLGLLSITNNPRVCIGNLCQTPSTAYFHGIIDEVRISNVSLDPTQFVPDPSAFDWKGGNSSSVTNWGVAGNWSPDTAVPDGVGVKVSFGSQVSANNVVDLVSVGRTVGSLTFTGSTSTTIQSTNGKSLTLDNGSDAATIIVTGSHTISAPVILDGDVDISGTGSLNLSGGISGDHALNVLGGSLTAKSIQVNTLTIGSGVSVTISPSSGTEGTSATVPEPSTFILLGFGAASLMGFGWWRRKRPA